MKHMYDSTAARDIPTDAQMVAGYINGMFKWSDADWNRFPQSEKVRIQIYRPGHPLIDDGDVLDVEYKDALYCRQQYQHKVWAEICRQRGKRPCIYTSLASRHLLDLPDCDYWLADYTGKAHLIPGTVATQYANPPKSGGHFDLSLVVDDWPYLPSNGVPVPNTPCAAFKITRSGNGYWMVGKDGGVFTYGDAQFHGSLAGTALNKPIIGFEPTPDEGGYYLVGEDYGVFTFGNAQYHGHPS